MCGEADIVEGHDGLAERWYWDGMLTRLQRWLDERPLRAELAVIAAGVALATVTLFLAHHLPAFLNGWQ